MVHIVALLLVHGRRGDRVLNERGVHVMHVNEEGKVDELWAVTDPKPHLALWGDASRVGKELAPSVAAVERTWAPGSRTALTRHSPCQPCHPVLAFEVK